MVLGTKDQGPWYQGPWSLVPRTKVLGTKDHGSRIGILKKIEIEVSGPSTHQIEGLDHYSGCQDMAHVKKRVPGPQKPQKIHQIQVFGFFLVGGGLGVGSGPILGLSSPILPLRASLPSVAVSSVRRVSASELLARRDSAD